jgi:hypothetical protein
VIVLTLVVVAVVEVLSDTVFVIVVVEVPPVARHEQNGVTEFLGMPARARVGIINPILENWRRLGIECSYKPGRDLSLHGFAALVAL